MRLFLAILVLSWADSAQAQTQYWDYKDWHVLVETVDTGEDVRVACSAWTGGDGDPSVMIEVSDGDIGPPDFYPTPMLLEYAPRGYPTVMQDGRRVLFAFDIDWGTEGFIAAGFDEAGFAWATASADPGESLEVLQAMRRAGVMWVTLDDEVVYEASLSGFTAAYGKIAEQCGFSTVGVID